MAAKYRKVDPRIWNDEKFRKLDGDEQRIALYCLTSDQTNRIGLFVFSPAKASEDLNMDFETFAKRFGNVSHTFNWGWDKGSRTLYFPTWWKYNAPDNPNHMKGNLEDCHDLPASPFWVKFCSNTQHLKGNVSQTFTHTLGKRFGNVTHQEQEQEQEQEQDSKGASAPEPDLPKEKKPRKRFVIPTVAEVSHYCQERGNQVDPEFFWDHYQANGWKQANGNAVKDWKACVRTWEKRNFQRNDSRLKSDGFESLAVPGVAPPVRRGSHDASR